ncbi:MAG: methylmalonyl Co-A mutase-associated GTPase MeaB [Anaerolineales bacterium]|jgi:LAO/AO transport system kinase
MTLATSVLEGNRLALARLLTQVENDTPEGRAAIGELFPYTGRAHLVGVTGAPGTGKSSLVNQLARHYRREDNSQWVAVVAVDPSSPFTGGAILGDRVRMRDLAGDSGVFIRSMASRGSLGGLAAATAGVVQILDAAGYGLIFIETVGAGQSEVEIARLAHTTLVVEAPGLGDDIQAIKAGILEIADILVVNKADLPGAELTERALLSMLQLAHPAPRVFHHHGTLEEDAIPVGNEDAPMWLPPIQRCVATEGDGISDLAQAIEQHRGYLLSSGEWARRDRERLQSELELLLRETLLARWQEHVPETRYQEAVQQVTQRQISPRQAVQYLIEGER